MKVIWNSCSWLAQVLAILIATPALAEIVDINLLQLNDIYEITPVEGGTRGGLARVATLRQQLYNSNHRTYTVLAGDTLSPSALGTAKINRRPLDGEQMVAVMNVLGLDYATFGNHEFDLPKEALYQRLQESKFHWVSSNVSDSIEKPKPFKGVPRSIVFNVKGDGGAVVRVGLIGVTLDSNKPDYVSYTNPIQAAKQQVSELEGKVDILIAITHLSIEDDRKLAEDVPEIDIILGGHEHENIQQWRSHEHKNIQPWRAKYFTPIFKADANARTVYVHKLSYDTIKKSLQINSTLIPITDKIPDEPETARIVKKWVEIGDLAFCADGFKPKEEIAKLEFTLDGLESSVRNKSTKLTELIAKAMLKEVPDADLAVFNSGSIRIDDSIPAGVPITQYDVIRILPFGGKVFAVQIKGSLLQKVLDKGQLNKGTGGYLQTANVSRQEAPSDKGQLNKGTGGYLQTANVSQKKPSIQWLIQGQPLDPNHLYKIAINDFLAKGKESGLDFLNIDNTDKQEIKLIAEKGDIRKAIIDYLKSEKTVSDTNSDWTCSKLKNYSIPLSR
ncbi:MAG: bifunctional metallophosphatase/5'-nucleotidase [Nostoc sp.]|uniref:bifunctional metallophosphatase/5'-nucleotidase n=1 Tax=Nostoc sp. TaxID=1180 RepID=UPI002FFD365C